MPRLGKVSVSNGGGRGIRTHETFLFTGFQDQLHRPLGQTSSTTISTLEAWWGNHYIKASPTALTLRETRQKQWSEAV